MLELSNSLQLANWVFSRVVSLRTRKICEESLLRFGTRSCNAAWHCVACLRFTACTLQSDT